MLKAVKVPVSKRALFARINRRLQRDGYKGSSYAVLKTSRGLEAQRVLGTYFISDGGHRGIVLDGDFDLVSLGRELRVLHSWEYVVD